MIATCFPASSGRLCVSVKARARARVIARQFPADAGRVRTSVLLCMYHAAAAAGGGGVRETVSALAGRWPHHPKEGGNLNRRSFTAPTFGESLVKEVGKKERRATRTRWRCKSSGGGNEGDNCAEIGSTFRVN